MGSRYLVGLPRLLRRAYFISAPCGWDYVWVGSGPGEVCQAEPASFALAFLWGVFPEVSTYQLEGSTKLYYEKRRKLVYW